MTSWWQNTFTLKLTLRVKQLYLLLYDFKQNSNLIVIRLDTCSGGSSFVLLLLLWLWLCLGNSCYCSCCTTRHEDELGSKWSPKRAVDLCKK